MNARELLEELERWVQAGWLRELDHAFAAYVARFAPADDFLLVLGAALASHQLGRGHACLDLVDTLREPARALALPPDDEGEPQGAAMPSLRTPAELLAGVDLARWQAALAVPLLVAPGAGDTPLVLAGGERLYLRRYWDYERLVREAIEARLDDDVPLPAQAVRGLLDVLFPRAGDGTDWQKVACALAARHRFAIVTGGPGTGKTTTVVRLLALLQHLALAGLNEGGSGRPLRIRLAAPTGKAAARLNESIAGAVQKLPLADLPGGERIRQAIPTEVTTVHRLLGSRPDTRRFRHDARNPLPLDVLVLDEASMVDLEMMACVLAALPPGARLVLLGDKDQLASVEAGAVLGELCKRADDGHYTPATRDWVAQASGEAIGNEYVDAAGHPLDQAVVKLRKSHRFSGESGIGRLADAVNAGQRERMTQVRASAPADLAFLELGTSARPFAELVLDGACERFPGAGGERAPVGLRHYLGVLHSKRPAVDAGAAAHDAWARDVLRANGEFQLLCAVRRGPQGVERLNREIARLLQQEKLVDAATGWYEGRPVMVTRNDYALGLMNGDVGIALLVPVAVEGQEQPQAKLRVAFPAGDGQGGVRWVLPSRLQAIETVFAMTVHKSQGSEFTHAALVLPARRSRVLTRELVYTGITRARSWFTLATVAGAGEVLDAAVQARMERTGGLLAG